MEISRENFHDFKSGLARKTTSNADFVWLLALKPYPRAVFTIVLHNFVKIVQQLMLMMCVK